MTEDVKKDVKKVVTRRRNFWIGLPGFRELDEHGHWTKEMNVDDGYGLDG